jgi:hypothetical protein
MDANLLLTIAGVGLAAGVAGIVVRWRGNGHGNGTPSPAWQTEMLRTLAKLPYELQGNFERLGDQLGEAVRGTERRRPAWQSRVHTAGPDVTGGDAGGGGGGGAVATAEPPAPGPQQLPPITLEIFNTIELVANDVYELIPPEVGIFSINVANLGPGNIYLRANADPVPNDPHTETLPAGAADNGIQVPGSLRVLADADSTITARLTYNQ